MWGWFSCASSQVRLESQRRGCSVRWCFLQFGKTYATTKRKLGIPKDLVDLSVLSFCCRELICDSEVRASRACPGTPPDKNQSITCKSLRFDLRLSASRITSDRKHSTMECHSRGLVTGSTSQKVTAEGTQACTHAILGLSSNTWNQRMPHDSPFLSVRHSVACKSRQT